MVRISEGSIAMDDEGVTPDNGGCNHLVEWAQSEMRLNIAFSAGARDCAIEVECHRKKAPFNLKWRSDGKRRDLCVPGRGDAVADQFVEALRRSS